MSRRGILIGITGGSVLVAGAIWLAGERPPSASHDEKQRLATSAPGPTAPPSRGAARDAGNEEADDEGARPDGPAIVRVMVLEKGVPIAGAGVRLGTFQQVTGPDGRVGFPRCERVSLRADGLLEAPVLVARKGRFSSGPVQVDCDHPPPDEVILELRLPAELHGELRAIETRMPIVGAEVRLVPAAVPPSRTDESGRFSMEGVPPGTYTLEAQARGFLLTRIELVALPPAAWREVLLELEPAWGVEGRVLTAKGLPAHAATLVAHTSGGRAVASGVSAEDGSFRLEALARGSTSLLVEADGEVSRVVEVPVPSSDVVITFGVGGSLEGFTRDSIGDPVADAEVILKPTGTVFAKFAKQAAARSGADGAHAFSRIVPGVYELSAGTSSLRSRTLRLIIAEGEVIRRDLKLIQNDQPIDGRVVAAETRAPIPGTIVSAGAAKTAARPDGTFELSGLEAGEYRVLAEAPGFASRDRRARTGARGVEIKLPLVLNVAGRVLDGATREPLRSFSIRVEREAPVRFDSPDGRFRTARDPDSQPEWLVFSSHGFQSAWRRASGRAGETVDLGDIVLEPGEPIVIHVVDPDGRSVAGATVHSIAPPRRNMKGFRNRPGDHPEEPPPARAFTRALTSPETAIGATDGKGEARSFPTEGLKCFVAVHPSFAPSGTNGCAIYVRSGVHERVSLVLERAAWIAGRALRQGRPAGGVTIASTDERLSAVTAPDGSFRLGPLSPGRHAIAVGPPGGTAGGAAPLLVELQPGEARSLEVEVP